MLEGTEEDKDAGELVWATLPEGDAVALGIGATLRVFVGVGFGAGGAQPSRISFMC